MDDAGDDARCEGTSCAAVQVLPLPTTLATSTQLIHRDIAADVCRATRWPTITSPSPSLAVLSTVIFVLQQRVGCSAVPFDSDAGGSSMHNAHPVNGPGICNSPSANMHPPTKICLAVLLRLKKHRDLREACAHDPQSLTVVRIWPLAVAVIMCATTGRVLSYC